MYNRYTICGVRSTAIYAESTLFLRELLFGPIDKVCFTESSRRSDATPTLVSLGSPYAMLRHKRIVFILSNKELLWKNMLGKPF